MAIIPVSAARYVAPAAFLMNFAAQSYGMLSNPSIKDVHDAHVSFWSPHPYFIAAFFAVQQVCQVAWLWKLWRSAADGGGRLTGGETQEEKDGAVMLDYVPFYTLGNVCIAAWMIFWNHSDLSTSNLFVTINTLAQLYFILFRLTPAETSTITLTNAITNTGLLTTIVSKTFAGIGVLDLLHNASVAYFDHAEPNLAVEALTPLIFGGLAALSAGGPGDWIFGGCLVYDLVALAVGQGMYERQGWGWLLGVYALATAGVVGARNYWRPLASFSSGGDYRAL